MNDMNTKFKIEPLSASERDVMRCLFFHGPTWDGNVPSKMGRDSLCKRGFVRHEFSFAFLTREGVQIAVQEMGLDREKDRWERAKRPPYLDFRSGSCR
jgi:hypothetical protein